jgi:ribosome maturation factor RimP
MTRSALSLLALLVAIVAVVDCFSPGWVSNSATKLNARKPSRVSDPSGPTVEMEPEELPEIDYDSLEETKFNEANIPIPNQPWRRGETAGCEAPIDAEWRKEAERMIEMGVQMAGGTYIDTTWYLTSVVVTIGMDFQEMKNDLLRAGGPEVRIDTSSKPIYYDPDDPEPEDIWYSEDEDTPFYERDDEAEKAIANRTYAKADVGDGESDSPESLGLDPSAEVPLYVDKEYREDLALRAHELRMLRDTKTDDPVDWDDMFWFDKSGPHKKYYGEKVNTAAISTIAGSIMDALNMREDELQILNRHEVVLASPSNPRSIDTQKKFDAAIGKRVAVRTHDPWESNRSLYGVLVDRNALDVYINQKGRLVTIPNNFVSGVELMLSEEEEEEWEAEEEAMELDDEMSEEEAHAELMKKRIAEFEAELEEALADDEYDDELEDENVDEEEDDDDEEEDDEDAIDEEDEH